MASDRTYGARRVWRDVLALGYRCGQYRIERLMRTQGLRARPRRRGLPKDAGTRNAIAGNVLDLYRHSSLTVSGKAVRGGNADTVNSTDIPAWHCPDHHGSHRTITSCFLKDKHEKPELPERLGNSLGHSHSIVAGGFPEMSYTTRLMPRTSLMIRFDTCPSSSCGK